MADTTPDTTPFGPATTAGQEVQFAIDPSRGLTRQRYAWRSSGTLFDSSRFSEVEAGIRIALGPTGSHEARIRSAFAGQYVSQALANPGVALVVDDSNVTTSNGQTQLSHGEIYFGAFWWDSANDQVDTGLGYMFDSSGWEFFIRSQGSHLGDSPIAQTDFIEPYDGTGQSNKVKTPADGFVGNWPYTWYNEGPLGGGILDKDANDVVEQVQEAVTGRPSIDTPNVPTQIVVRNAGTGSALGVELGGMQYTTYGAAGAPETRDTYGADEPSSANVTTGTNDPIDPTGETGDPIFAVERESNERDLELRLDEFRAQTDNEAILYFFDEYDYATATGADSSLESTFRFNSEETKTQLDRSATSYSPETAVFRGMKKITSSGGLFDAVTEADIEDRIPIDATRVVTGVNTGTNATVKYVAQMAEGY